MKRENKIKSTVDDLDNDVIFPEPSMSFLCYHMTCDHYCDHDM